MRIIIAPDSFKGSLSAIEVANIIANALHEVDGNIETVCVPIADGGEGTLDAFYHSIGGQLQTVRCNNPMMEVIECCYLVLANQEKCVIEMAQSTGLHLVNEANRNPLIASSFGMGEIIAHALDAGHRNFIVGIGGSATNDGGYGLLRALGMRFLNHEGQELGTDIAELQKLSKIDTTYFDKRVMESKWTIACDVDNPLLGENGATAVFGAQKGVTSETYMVLEQALTQFAHVVETHVGKQVHKQSGAGAAGGVGMALLAFFHAEMQSGIDVVIETTRLAEKMKTANYVITGEGFSDAQTLRGKAPLGISKLARQMQVPVWLLSGKIHQPSRHELQCYFDKLISVTDETISKEDAMSNAKHYLFEKVKQLAIRLLEK